MKPIHTWFLLVLLGSSAATDIRSGTRDRIREIPLEVLRCDAEPAGEATLAQPVLLGDGAIAGAPRLHGYVLRLQLEPGERILSVHGIVRDGFAHRGRSGKARKAARLLGALGYQLVLRRIPGELQSSLGPIAGLVLPAQPDSPTPAAVRVLRLRGESFHHHASTAAAVVMLEANDLTRVELTRITTRHPDRRRKQRARSPAVLVRGGGMVSRDELITLLAGQRGTEPRRRSSGRDPVADWPPSPDAGGPPLAARPRDRNAHRPPPP